MAACRRHHGRTQGLRIRRALKHWCKPALAAWPEKPVRIVVTFPAGGYTLMLSNSTPISIGPFALEGVGVGVGVKL